MEQKLLNTYLNDHLAGATAGVNLAKRARGAEEGTELGSFLDGLAKEIEEDLATLKRVMGHFGASEDRVKVGAAWMTERLGRLKLNGRLLERSPLSRLIELEGLHLGVTGKADLWKTLQRTVGDQLEGFDLEELIRRAERQQSELQDQRLLAAERAFGDAP